MSGFLWLVVASFATERLARLVATEEGPFALFQSFRNRFTEDTWVARGIRCPYCVGFWFAAMMAAYLVWLNVFPIDVWPLVWWGIAGGAVTIEKWWKR